MIPPLGNTTFDVVFLGREEGPVENTLYVHTSAGSFRFVVRAHGTPNPFRLKPLVGVRMPLNSSYSPLISLHNPNPEPIQVCKISHLNYFADKDSFYWLDSEWLVFVLDGKRSLFFEHFCILDTDT